MKDDLIEQCAGAVVDELNTQEDRFNSYSSLSRAPKGDGVNGIYDGEVDCASIARAVLAIARPAILEEAAAEADALADRHDVAAIGAIFDVGVAKYRGAETALRCFAKRLRALATTGQEGGR